MEITDEVFISREITTNTLIGTELERSFIDDAFRAIMDVCWTKQKLKPEDFQYFASIIGTPDGKKIFISALNDKRKIGAFLIPEENFITLGKLFRLTLDSLMAENSFSCVRQCIILSQTFYNKDKVYVQNLIVSHAIWENKSYWIQLVEDSIDKEIDNLQEFERFDDSKEEKENRSKDVILTTLTSYADIMNCFRVEKETITEVIRKCKDKFFISTQELEYILNLAYS